MTLADRIRASREQWVSTGGFEFQIRRPTRVQLGRWANQDVAALVVQCVVGWKLPEHEIVAGGGGKVPEFDSEAFREWIEDRPEIFAELAEKIQEAIRKHEEDKAAAEKN